MRQSGIPVRCAKALFMLAKDMNILEEIRTDAVLVHHVSKNISDLKIFLANPVISNSQKKIALKEIFGGKVNQVMENFLMLVTNKNREVYIEDICRNFIDMYKKHMGIITAHIATATPLGESLRSEIISIINENYTEKIELSESVNKDLIGGIILRINDMQYDASISNKLVKIKRSLINTTFEQRFVRTTEKK